MFEIIYMKMKNARLYSGEFARYALGNHLKVEGDTLAINKSANGKPYLRDYPEVFYNISHTTDAIVCAISDKPIGIDMENIRTLKLGIVKKYYTQREKEFVFSSNSMIDERFTRIWTMKEAYVKWCGEGMSMEFDSFDILSCTKLLNITNFIYMRKYITVYNAGMKYINYLSD